MSEAVLVAREDSVIREVVGTIEHVGDAARFLDRESTVRRDGTRFSFSQQALMLALFDDEARRMPSSRSSPSTAS